MQSFRSDVLSSLDAVVRMEVCSCVLRYFGIERGFDSSSVLDGNFAICYGILKQKLIGILYTFGRREPTQRWKECDTFPSS
jgi:hypothetical protein